MAAATAFVYTPTAGAINFAVNGVNCAIDFVGDDGQTEIKFGLLELPSAGQAQWMGVDANTSGGPAGLWQTPSSPLYDVSGALWTLTNTQGIGGLTALKASMNAQLTERFPAGGTVALLPGQFTSDSQALAYLIKNLPSTFKVVNGVIT